MKTSIYELTRGSILSGFALLLVLIASVLTAYLPLQISLLGILLISSLAAGSIARLLIVAATFVPILAFIRRITAGSEARVDFDPLILFPFILVAIAVASAFRPRELIQHPYVRLTSGRTYALAVIFVAAVGLSIAFSRSFAPDVLYFAVALLLPLLLMVTIASGAVPDVWDRYERYLPLLGLFVGAYGILQFLWLPEWDRNWMISSELQSIGQPVPLLVRVFGMAESPGPYAAFLGLCIIVCVSRAINSKAIPQIGWFMVAGILVVPLLLSGVRSALLSLLVCAATAAVMRGKGLGRVVPIVFIALVGYGIDRLVGTFGSNSTILTSDRYTTFDPSQDDSFQARLGLLQYLSNPWPHAIGHPGAAPVDNLLIDIMRAYGLLPFAIFVFLSVMLLRFSFQLAKLRGSSSVGLSTLYVLMLGVSGNLFLSSFGILMGLIFGSALKRVLDASPGPRGVVSLTPALRSLRR